jgi:hypothetical protein
VDSGSDTMGHEALSFWDWPDVLASSQLPESVIESHRRAIINFLRFCKAAHAPATVVLARQVLGSPDGVRLRKLILGARGGGMPDIEPEREGVCARPPN